jgi:thymidine kinase
MRTDTTVYFKYGSMNSGKSLELIKVAYNYSENDIHSLVLKS